MNKDPLVSIIVRTKDRPKLLKKALQSIAAQTYRPIEVVLVNDGGCDLDVGELKAILGDVSLNYIRLEKNMGRAHAGNVGIENTKGEYIGFLDDDDGLYSEHVAIIVGCLKQSDVKVAYTDTLMVTKEYDLETFGMTDVAKEIVYSEDFNYNKLVFENYIPLICLLFDREVIEKFDTRFELYEDWDLLIRVGERYPFYHIKKITSEYSLWSSDLQISQRNKDYILLEQSYVKVISKHIAKFTEKRIHHYISDFVKTRDALKELNKANEYQIETINEQIKTINEQIKTINNLSEKINNHEKKIAEMEAIVAEKESYCRNLEVMKQEIEEYVKRLETTLNNIYSSHGWKTLLKYYRIRDKLFPYNSKRKIFARLVNNFLWNPKETLKKLNKSNFKKLMFYIKTSEPAVLEQKIEKKLSTDKEAAFKHKENIYGDEAKENLKDALQTFSILKLKIFLSDIESKLKFPYYDSPLVSIILVTFKKAWFTFRCLESLKAHIDLPYEVIIVDNDSKDETPELLNKLENVKIIKNAINYGFVIACNQGSKIASGKYLLFLNNDTEVLPNWLSTLVATIEKDSTYGAVGARLILPDGRLQEAGNIIWNDGSVFAYGRHDDNPFKPEYSFLREVDYCSGACLLVRTDLFKKLGGFDEKYSPAYYEESDLCMQLRSNGYKTIYQPSVSIIHYEFGSSSLNEAVGLQQKNHLKFIEKWKDVLKKHYQGLTENIILARDKNDKKRILVIDDRIPAVYLGSGFPRMYKILQFLAELGYKLTFLPLQNPGIAEPYTKHLQQLGIEVLYNDGTSKLDIKNFLNERKRQYDAVLISRPHNAHEVISLIKSNCPNCPVIYDAEALFSQREIARCKLSGIRLSQADEQKIVRDEIALLKHVDVVVTVSSIERDIMIQNGVCNVVVWGHPISVKPKNRSFSEKHSILFVGGFLTPLSPNEDAMLHFVNEVFPLVRERLDAQLFIVGTNYLDSIKNLASSSIVVTGRVENLEEYYEQCRIFIVPTRYAAGIPWKLHEAMSYGLPAVVTPLIANQLNLTDGDEVLIGKTPREFADRIISLYENEALWNAIQNGGFRHIEVVCNPQKLKQNIEETLKKYIH